MLHACTHALTFTSLLCYNAANMKPKDGAKSATNKQPITFSCINNHKGAFMVCLASILVVISGLVILAANQPQNESGSAPSIDSVSDSQPAQLEDGEDVVENQPEQLLEAEEQKSVKSVEPQATSAPTSSSQQAQRKYEEQTAELESKYNSESSNRSETGSGETMTVEEAERLWRETQEESQRKFEEQQAESRRQFEEMQAESQRQFEEQMAESQRQREQAQSSTTEYPNGMMTQEDYEYYLKLQAEEEARQKALEEQAARVRAAQCDQYYSSYSQERSSIISNTNSAISNVSMSCGSSGGCPAVTNIERERDRDLEQLKTQYRSQMQNAGCDLSNYSGL